MAARHGAGAASALAPIVPVLIAAVGPAQPAPAVATADRGRPQTDRGLPP